MAVELQFFGATERVTGSLYVLTAGQSRVVLECGLVQGMADEEALNREPLPFTAEEIHAAGTLGRRLIDWYSSFENRPPVYLVHGEKRGQRPLLEKLKNDLKAPAHIAKYRQNVTF